jgi:glycosyltransferase involved in cell wall biosynthesis
MPKTYVLITPAKNEETFIEKTLAAVVSQTILPKQWIIVNDGSSDGTEEIVLKYAGKHDFIKLVTIKESLQRNFKSKVEAFAAGYAHVKKFDYAYLGNLDADVSFDSRYYETILDRFARNPQLGIAGGAICETYFGKFKPRPSNSVRSVAGAVQLFRRECFEAIAGYVPLDIGGEDWMMEVMARMRGWQVESFPDIKVFHHKSGSGTGRKILRTCFVYGKLDFMVGCHPLFEMMKCARRVIERPYLIGALCHLSGYLWASINKTPRPVSQEIVKYLRQEQLQRMRLPILQRRKEAA